MRRVIAVVACVGVCVVGTACRNRYPGGVQIEERLASRQRLIDVANKEQLAAFYDFDKKVLYLADQARVESLLKDQAPGGLMIRDLRDGRAQVGGQWDDQKWDDVVRVGVLNFPDLQDLYFEVGDYRLWFHGQLEHSNAAVRGNCFNIWGAPITGLDSNGIPNRLGEYRLIGSHRTHTRAHKYLQDDGPFIKWERLWEIEVDVRFGYEVGDCQGPFTLKNQNERWLSEIQAWPGPY